MPRVGSRFTVLTTGGAVRVVGGRLGGRRLLTVPGKDTRPTSARVREPRCGIRGEGGGGRGGSGRGCLACSREPGRWASRRCRGGGGRRCWSSRRRRRWR